MGIPRLTTYLSPYAVPTILGCESQRCPNHPRGLEQSNSKIIIDGPSFAFEVYDRLITNKPSVLDILGAIPSYHEIGKAVLSFLEELEGCGLIMYASYAFTHPVRIHWSRLDECEQSAIKSTSTVSFLQTK